MIFDMNLFKSISFEPLRPISSSGTKATFTEKSQRIVVIDSRSEVHLVLGVYFPSAADQICFEPPARTVVKDQLGHVAPSLVGGAQAPIPIGPIRLYGLVAGQRKAVARKLRDVDRAMKIGGVGGLDETSGDFFPVLIYEFTNLPASTGLAPCRRL